MKQTKVKKPKRNPKSKDARSRRYVWLPGDVKFKK
jgi:hypothetical protein